MRVVYIAITLFVIFSIYILSQVNSLTKNVSTGLIIFENSDTCYNVGYQKYIYSWEDLLPFNKFPDFSTVFSKTENCSEYLIQSDKYIDSLFEEPFNPIFFESIIYHTDDSLNIKTKFDKYINSYRKSYPERKEFIRKVYVLIINTGEWGDSLQPTIEENLQKAILIRYSEHFLEFIDDNFIKK